MILMSFYYINLLIVENHITSVLWIHVIDIICTNIQSGLSLQFEEFREIVNCFSDVNEL